ncbi:trophoblast glycoprotein-like [Macrobrachium nipponense]|uniref:trophoblast glycoprotein-like n=1 Tax=Macrobrachium nipponense TaxID=159736 RepID=UPI0030C83E95
MAMKFLIISVALLAACEAIIDETGCPDAFKKRCHCGMAFSTYDNFKERKFTVNCTNTGFSSADMLTYLPEHTEVLIFTGNTIETLPANILDNFKEYENLETIDMSNNDIRFIQGKTFHKVYNVRTLILNHNDIDITEDKARPRIFSNFENLERLHLTNAFTEKVNASLYLQNLEDVFYESDLECLKVLHLEQNEIRSIGNNEKVFCQLPDLEQLLLGDNRLQDLDFRIDCLPNLRYIDLERNMISRLSKPAMSKLDNFTKNKNNSKLQVKLSDNPFNCDCRASDFYHWLKSSKSSKVDVIDWDKYDCIDGYPQENVGLNFSMVHDLRCPETGTSNVVKKHVPDPSSSYQYSKESSEHIARHSSVTIGVLAFFLVFTTSMLFAVAYFQRQKVKGIIMPYWDFITRKIGYVGISNEEAPQEVNV